MARPPRKMNGGLLSGSSFLRMMFVAICLCASGLVPFLLYFYRGGRTWNSSTCELKTAQTMAFYGWLIGLVSVAQNVRTLRTPVLLRGFHTNVSMLLWTLFVAGVGVSLSCFALVSSVMGIVPLVLSNWGWVILCSAGSSWWLEIVKLVMHCCCNSSGRRAVNGPGDSLRESLLDPRV